MTHTRTVAQALAAITPVSVVRYQDPHKRAAAQYAALWNHGAELANRAFNQAVPDLRPEHAEPGLAAIEAELAHYRSTDANPVIISALETARANVLRWLDERLDGRWSVVQVESVAMAA